MQRKNLISLHEAIVLALIARPARAANFKQIADFIITRNLYQIRKGNIPIEKQIMLRATKAQGSYAHLFEDEGNNVISLRDSNSKLPLKVWNGLEALLDFDRPSFNPDAKSINLIDKSDDSKEIVKLKISPVDIICILSHEKSREKKFFILERTTADTPSIRSYYFNSQKYNFETLCEYLDPLSHHLTMVSRNAIINVAHYELIKKHLLRCNLDGESKSEYYQVNISAKKEDSRFIREFKIIKEAHTQRILLQRAALAYKTEMGL